MHMAVNCSNLSHHEVHVNNQFSLPFELYFVPFNVDGVFEWLKLGVKLAQVLPWRWCCSMFVPFLANLFIIFSFVTIMYNLGFEVLNISNSRLLVGLLVITSKSAVPSRIASTVLVVAPNLMLSITSSPTNGGFSPAWSGGCSVTVFPFQWVEDQRVFCIPVFLPL